jgi:hypothetical protein
MVGWKRRVVAFHEAGHAVVTAHFGLKVVRVTAGKEAVVPSQSAAWLAKDLDTPAQIEAYEKDAVIALAGLASQRREYPDRTGDLDSDIVLADDDDDDMCNARSAIYKIVCLMNNKSFPSANAAIVLDEPTKAAMRVVFDRLKWQTAAPIKEQWPAITRVARALERHDVDQTALVRLINGGKRDAAQ